MFDLDEMIMFVWGAFTLGYGIATLLALFVVEHTPPRAGEKEQ